MIHKGDMIRQWLANLFSILVLAYLVLPLIVLIPMALTSGNTLTFPTPGWSLRWFEEIINDEKWINALINSLIIGVSATFLASILAIPAAIGLTWGKFPGKKMILTLAAAPLVVPVVILGVATFSFYASLEMVGSRLPLIFTHAAMAVPVMLTTVAASLAGFDRTLIRAAASLGAGYGRIFFKVLLPLIAPGAMTGALISFLISFDEVVVASFLSMGTQRTLPRLIFSGVRESVSPAIAAVALCLIIFSAFALALAGWLHSRRAKMSRT